MTGWKNSLFRADGVDHGLWDDVGMDDAREYDVHCDVFFLLWCSLNPAVGELDGTCKDVLL